MRQEVGVGGEAGGGRKKRWEMRQEVGDEAGGGR